MFLETQVGLFFFHSNASTDHCLHLTGNFNKNKAYQFLQLDIGNNCHIRAKEFVIQETLGIKGCSGKVSDCADFEECLVGIHALSKTKMVPA